MVKPLQFDRLGPFRLPGSSHSGKQPQLMTVLRKLWRRKVLILSTTMVLTVVAGIAVSRLTPLYSAESLLLLEAEQNSVVDIQAVISGLPSDAATIESEIEVLKSRGLAKKVVQRMSLAQIPEFNLALQPPTWKQNLKNWVNTNIVEPYAPLVGLDMTAEMDIPQQDPASTFDEVDVVDMYLDRLTVKEVGRSRAIRLSFISEDPDLAASVVNTAAELYIVERLEGKFEATRKVMEWLNTRMADLRSDVEAKERAVEEFRQENNLLQGKKGEVLIGQEASELNTALTKARTERAAAEAQLAQIKRLMATGQAASADVVLQSSLIQRLREDEARLEAQISEYSTRYAKNHPTMRNAVAQLEDVKRSIDREINKVAKALENQAVVARSNEAALQSRVRTLKTEIAQSNTADIQIRSLEQEAVAARDLLDTFLARFIATSAQQDIVSQTPDARIVSYADVPDEPSFPSVKPILFMAMLSAMSIGIALAFVLEMMDTSFRSSEDIETETGARVLGHVPLLTKWGARRKGLAHHVLKYPNSIATESIRRLYTGIMLSQGEAPTNRILFTSAQPGEGKTSVSMALARIQAMSGDKTLLIDADIRQAKIHQVLGLKNGPGLTDYLTDLASLEQIVQQDKKTPLHVITAGKTAVSNPQAAFSSDRMKSLLDMASQAYDIVIVDSPPVSAVSDAVMLGRLTMAVFVIRWGGAPRDVVVTAMRQLMESGCHLVGTVLSQVDPKRHVQYGYGDAGGYTNAVKKYYIHEKPRTVNGSKT